MRTHLRASLLATAGLAAVLPASSCFCLDLFSLLNGGGFDFPDAGLPTEPPDNGVLISEDDLLGWVSGCPASDATMTDERMDAATAAFAGFDDGTIEVELTDDRCTRFTRTMEGGVLTSARFIRFTGETVSISDGGKIAFAALFHTQAKWERDASGALHGFIHDDGDARSAQDEPRFEIETLEDPANHTRQTTRYASNGDVEWQITITETDEGTVQTIDRLVDGEVVTETTHVGIENRSQAPDCNAAGVTCDDATSEALDHAMDAALKRGSECLKRISVGRDDTWMRYVMLKHRWTEAHSWGCLPTGCGIARWCDTCQDAGDPLTIDVDFTTWSTFTVANPEQGVGVLFHELMHGVLGYHPEIVVNSSIYDETTRRDKLMRRYTDRVNACEAYCFAPAGASVTKCSCAACLETKVCDDRCSGLADCTESQNGSFIMSEAVGTACVNFDESIGANGEEKATWFSTKAACKASSCEAGGGRCDSKSLSCEPGCE